MQIIHHKQCKNYDLRPEKSAPIRYIIVHYTEISFDETMSLFCDNKSKVSSHYVISKNGKIHQLIGEFYRAWHAGVSYWQGETSLNDFSIGIEIENSGKEKFTDDQYKATYDLCKYLQKKYYIRPENILGHNEIAPQRKLDPGIYFNWQKVIPEKIYFNPEAINFDAIEYYDLNDKQINELQFKLSKVGYKIVNSGILDIETSNVIRAFQSRYNPAVFFQQGGIDFYCNVNNICRWDNLSEKIINVILSRNN